MFSIPLTPIAHVGRGVQPRIQRWCRTHLFGNLSVAARIRAWATGRRGDSTTAAAIWRALARGATTAADATTALTQYGRYCLAGGRLRQARRALERALAARPDDPLAREFLGRVAMAQGDSVAAIRHWRMALEAQTAPSERARCLRVLIDLTLNRNEFAQAAALIERLAQTKTRATDIEALKLRARLAKKQMDDHELRAAWHALHKRFPKVAQDTLGWLAYTGGEDAADAPRYTPDDIDRARDEQTAARALWYLELRVSRSEHLDLARRAATAFPRSTQLYLKYLWCLGGYLSCAAELNEYQTAAHAFSERFAQHPESRRWPAAAAVTANDCAAVERYLADNGAGGNEDLRIWLTAKYGEHAEAYALDAQKRRKYPAFAEHLDGLDLRPLNAQPRPTLRDKILLFACFRDERDFLPWFLDYYRSVGVDWFFIVDNHSTDGTTEYLAAQKDATVFASKDNYAHAHLGIRWINALRHRYGDDNWCIHVDSDEQLVVPEIESRGLRGFVDDMAANGEEVMPAFMLDTYPTDMAALRGFRPGHNPLAYSNLIDTDYFFYGRLSCCFRGVRGGVRDRLFDFHNTLEKAPILRGGGGNDMARVYLNAHATSYARVSRRCGVLLHHKLLREALDLLKPQDQTAARVADRVLTCRARHTRYRASGLLAADADIPRAPSTLAYQDSAQLARLGLLGEPAAANHKAAA